MLCCMCKENIHQDSIIESDFENEGSITLDQELMTSANLLPSLKPRVVIMDENNRMFSVHIKDRFEKGCDSTWRG